MKKLFTMIVLGALITTVNCWADDDEGSEVKIGFKELPAAVQQTALKFFKVENIKEIEKKAEEDTAQYDVEGLSNGKKLDLTFASDGTLIQTTVKIDFASLPKLAQKALLKDYPQGEIKEVEKVVETSYKIEIIIDGEKREIEVKASGDIEDENDSDGINDNEDKENDDKDADDDENGEEDDD